MTAVLWSSDDVDANERTGQLTDFARDRSRLSASRGRIEGTLASSGPILSLVPYDISDEEALALARNGDERGFVHLYRAIQPALLRYLRVSSPDTAEDVGGEVWLHVVRDLAKFNGDVDAFRGWVFTIARHRAVDQGRARAARPSVPVADVDPGTRVPSAEDVVVEYDATQRALALVATLPPDQAEMVMLRVVAGLDVDAVAAIVGKKPGTVRVAVHRALKTLRDRAPGPDPRTPREVV